jgi:hypothetical protein
MKAFIVGIAVAMSCMSNDGIAQLKNLKIDEAMASSSIGHPTVVINPRNPLNIVAASAPDNLYISNDGGSSWQKQKAVSSYGFFGNLVLVCDNKGTFYLIHSSNSSGKGLESETTMEVLVCQTSSDGGKTWDDGSTFGYAPPSDLFSPSASIDSKGTLCVVWTQSDKFGSDDKACRSVVMISFSSNGKKFSKPVELSNHPGNCANGDSTLAGASVDVGDKRIYVAWSNGTKIFLDRSFDAGGMWLSNDITVENLVNAKSTQPPPHNVYPGLPVLKIDMTKSERRGLLFMTWADARSGNSDADIWFIRSHNFGDIWTPFRKVNNDTTKNHQYNPVMAFDKVSGYIYILYLDSRGEDGSTNVYLAYSRNSGNSFNNVKITSESFTKGQPHFGGLLSLSAHNGNIIPVWIRQDNEQTSLMSTPIIHESVLPK